MPLLLPYEYCSEFDGVYNSANTILPVEFDIILDIEEVFNINIDNQSMERMLTVKVALEIIETKLSEK